MAKPIDEFIAFVLLLILDRYRFLVEGQRQAGSFKLYVLELFFFFHPPSVLVWLRSRGLRRSALRLTHSGWMDVRMYST